MVEVKTPEYEPDSRVLSVGRYKTNALRPQLTRLFSIQKRLRLLACIALLSIGSISLILSYMYTSTILTFIGLGLMLWGVMTLNISRTRYVHEEAIHGISVSTIKSLDAILAALSNTGSLLFFHPRHLKGLKQGYIFLSYDGVLRIPREEDLEKEKIFYDEPKGALLVAPNQGIVDILEKKLNVNFATVDLAYLQRSIPRVLVDDLRIVDDFSIISDENEKKHVRIQISGKMVADVCELLSKETKLGSKLGCPICSSFALIVSKAFGKPVVIRESIVRDSTILTIFEVLDL
jgi:hypothetical protein